MIKLIALIKRKPGLSREAFVDYYENRHVPFVSAKAKEFIVDYCRNYVCPSDAEEDTGGRLFDEYDVITEVWLQDRAALDGLMDLIANSSWSAELEADENKFVDRPSMRMFVTEERR